MLAAVCDVDAGQGRGRRRDVRRAVLHRRRRRCSRANSSTPSTSSPGRTRIARLPRLTIAHGVADDRAEALRADLGGLRRHRRGRRKGRRLARRARELPLPGADARRAQGDRQRRDRRSRAGRASASAPASTSTRRSPISSTRSGSPSPMSASTCSTSRASSSARSRASPARRSGATRRCGPRTPRPCCCATRAARVSVVECTYEARRSPTPSPKRCSRSRARAARSSSTAGCRMTVTSDGEAERKRHRRAAAVLDQRIPGTSARKARSAPAAISSTACSAACRPRRRGEDNLKTYALVDAAYRAAAEHRAVAPRQVELTMRCRRRRPVTTMEQPAADKRQARRGDAFAITVAFELVEGALPKFHRLVAENARAVGRARARLPALRRADAPANGAMRHAGLPLRDLPRPRGLRPASRLRSLPAVSTQQTARPGAQARR